MKYKGKTYTENSKGYYRNRYLGMLHRVIWEEVNGKISKGMQVDHINGNKSDNRIENLQLLTDSQNKQRSSNGTIIPIRARFYARRMINSILKDGYFGTKCGAYMFNQTAFI